MALGAEDRYRKSEVGDQKELGSSDLRPPTSDLRPPTSDLWSTESERSAGYLRFRL
jgi:hypothetical protein